MRRLFYATTTIVHAVVADDVVKACAIADDAVQSALVDGGAILRHELSAVLATEEPPYLAASGLTVEGVREALSALPEWEYPLPEDSYTIEDPDAVAEAEHHRRRWTIAQWVAEQRRLAPAPVEAPTTVGVNDDWRGPPSEAEVAAHHQAHADRYGASVWHMIADGDGRAVAVKARDGALGFMPHESTRWRPADALHTPVAWSTPRGAL